MNQQQYMIELKRELKERNVNDIEEILEEYEQHFTFKLKDGYSEEEIAAKLEKPALIADQFAMETRGYADSGKGSNALTGIGLGFLDIVMSLLFILFYGWGVVLGVFSLAVSVLGICLIGNLNIAALIPAMPYLGSLVLGISMLGLGTLSSVGTYYSFRYVTQWGRVFIRWQRNVWRGKRYPSLSMQPEMSGKCKRRLRMITVASLLFFGVAFLIGLLVMFAYTGFRPFWHELGWFV